MKPNNELYNIEKVVQKKKKKFIEVCLKLFFGGLLHYLSDYGVTRSIMFRNILCKLQSVFEREYKTFVVKISLWNRIIKIQRERERKNAFKIIIQCLCETSAETSGNTLACILYKNTRLNIFIKYNILYYNKFIIYLYILLYVYEKNRKRARATELRFIVFSYRNNNNIRVNIFLFSDTKQVLQ